MHGRREIGDFDLLFGAARSSIKITEPPIRYRERIYDVTKISRFGHGWLARPNVLDRPLETEAIIIDSLISLWLRIPAFLQ
jgi:hypothetical protein